MVGTGAGRVNVERACRIDSNAGSRWGGAAGSQVARRVYSGERVTRRILIPQENTGGLDAQERGHSRRIGLGANGDAAGCPKVTLTQGYVSANCACGAKDRSITAIEEASCDATGIGERAIGVECQTSRNRPTDLHAVHIDVVGDQAFAGVGDLQGLSRNDGVVGIVIGHGGYSSSTGRQCRAIGTDVSQHTSVAGRSVAREAQLTVIDGEG